MKRKEDFNEELNKLYHENSILNYEISEIKAQLKDICFILEDLSVKIHKFYENKDIYKKENISTDRHIIQTNS
ncbi:MAG: hypothetical protein OQK82_06805, partial [Candidatus Pacearchaeota archaeon]|nr:hypothetical protein [Candidatus Pacearchaeota archaeon]